MASPHANSDACLRHEVQWNPVFHAINRPPTDVWFGVYRCGIVRQAGPHGGAFRGMATADEAR